MRRTSPFNRLSFSFLLIGVFTLSLTGFSARTMSDGLQYRATKVGSDRDIDDKFNEMAEDGWYPRFVLKYEGDARLIFERPRNKDERLYDLEYKATVVKKAKKIDDKLNDMAEDGWFPRFVFRTGALNQNWRIILERDPEDDVTNLEYRAVVIDEGRNVDDKFNQVAADGWFPLFLVRGLSDDHRMLFARTKGDTERTMRFMAKTTRNIKRIDDLYDEHAEDGWEPMFLFKDENDAFRSLFQKYVDEDPIPFEYQATRIDEMSEIDDKFNQYGADDWYPMFVIRDVEELIENYTDTDGIVQSHTVENVRWRMLFGRPTD